MGFTEEADGIYGIWSVIIVTDEFENFLHVFVHQATTCYNGIKFDQVEVVKDW